MGDLARRETALPALLVESARAYAEAARAERTRAAYRSAWGLFAVWCEERGLQALPAAPATVAMYLAARADAGRKPATLELDLAAIGEAHRAGGLDGPRGSAEVQTVLRGVRRVRGAAQRQVAPLLPSDMRAVVAALPAGLKGIRDRALLLVGWAGAMRRSELVALQVEDLRWVERGVDVEVRRSKTDQEGRGLVKAIPAGGGDLCPVRALRAWLEATGIEGGPVFREVTRHGRIGERALADRSVPRVIKAACERVGLDPERYSGHSLRAGLATAAARAGKDVRAIMRQTGHRSAAMVQRYVRDAERWDDNAAEGLLG